MRINKSFLAEEKDLSFTTNQEEGRKKIIRLKKQLKS